MKIIFSILLSPFEPQIYPLTPCYAKLSLRIVYFIYGNVAYEEGLV
jgi:hypothetical protein